MSGAGILSGDMLVVDRSRIPRSGDIVVAVVYGEFTVKRWVQRKNRWFLIPENSSFTELEISAHTAADHFELWGVVTYAVHCFKQISP